MKLTTLLLIVAYLQVNATGDGQKVTISGKETPLEKVFNMIKKQRGKETITNAKGEFELPAVSENGFLVNSFIGYASQQGNVTKVNVVEIDKQPVTNPMIALQGELPGLNIHQMNCYVSGQICNYISSLDLPHTLNGNAPESP
jgi:hypothetical protein